MNVKHFRVRVSGDHLAADQEAVNRFLDSVQVKQTATHFITGLIDYWSVLVFFEPKAKQEKPLEPIKDQISVLNYEELSNDEKDLLDSLKNWRAEKSSKLGLPQYMICHNSELITIAKLKPHTEDELRKIKGFGDYKVSRYGRDILNLLQAV